MAAASLVLVCQDKGPELSQCGFKRALLHGDAAVFDITDIKPNKEIAADRLAARGIHVHRSSPREITGFKSRIFSGFMIEEISMKTTLRTH